MATGRRGGGFRGLTRVSSLAGVCGHCKFSRLTRRVVTGGPGTPCMITLFSVSGFGFVGSVCKRICNSETLGGLTSDVGDFFPSSALLKQGNNSRFYVLLPGYACSSIGRRLRRFAVLPGVFSYGKGSCPFCVSLKCTRCPVTTSGHTRLVHYTSTTLCRMGLRNGGKYVTCERKLRSEDHGRLKFTLGSVSRRLPNTFVVCETSGRGSRLFCTGRRFLRVAKCGSVSRLFGLAGGDFQGLVQRSRRRRVRTDV